MKKNRPERGSHAPGTFWYYNNWDFNALGTIFEKEAGLKIGEAFYQRIAKPIGMQDFQPDDIYYLGGPISVHRAYMFEITARDLARFGLVYLRHGQWNGKQIVPEAWVQKSSHANETVKVNGVDLGGYEYLWWVEYSGVHFPEVSEESVMPKRHGELKEYGIGPAKGPTASCKQVSGGLCRELTAYCKIDTQSREGVHRRRLRSSTGASAADVRSLLRTT